MSDTVVTIIISKKLKLSAVARWLVGPLLDKNNDRTPVLNPQLQTFNPSS